MPVPSFFHFAEGWITDCECRRHSEATIENRRYVLGKFRWWTGRNGVVTVDRDVIRRYLAYVSTGHKSAEGRWGNAREIEPVKPATVASHHRVLRTLCRWIAEEGGSEGSLMGHTAPPVDRADDIMPFSGQQVEALIAAAEASCRRDIAIVLLLLDSGLRVGELCALRIGDVDTTKRLATVQGKGGKSRQIYFGSRTARAMWRSLEQSRLSDPLAPFFTLERGQGRGDFLRPNGVQQLFRRLGRQAEIRGVRCSPHTCRHTFAVNFLRNGGDQFSLMRILGHTNVRMTARYVQLAQQDVARKHRECSPIDRMGRR